jgi:hypothetical protein
MVLWPDLFALGERFVVPAGEQLTEIVAMAEDGFGVVCLPLVGEVAAGAGLGQGLGVQCFRGATARLE